MIYIPVGLFLIDVQKLSMSKQNILLFASVALGLVIGVLEFLFQDFTIKIPGYSDRNYSNFVYFSYARFSLVLLSFSLVMFCIRMRRVKNHIQFEHLNQLSLILYLLHPIIISLIFYFYKIERGAGLFILTLSILLPVSLLLMKARVVR